VDIIIEDGGHTMQQQQVSLGFLFPYVKANGLYIIEDLHSSYIGPWLYNTTNTAKTTLRIVRQLRDTRKIDSDFILETEAQFIIDNYLSCVIERGKSSEICFISKK
jgi:hypothetical protein